MSLLAKIGLSILIACAMVIMPDGIVEGLILDRPPGIIAFSALGAALFGMILLMIGFIVFIWEEM